MHHPRIVASALTGALLLAARAEAGPAAPAAGAGGVAAEASHAFPRPAALAAAIDFWKAIFTRYGARQVVVHDARYVDKVYAFLDLRGASDKEVAAATTAEKKRIQAVLLDLDRRHGWGSERPTGEARRIHDLFRDVDEPRKFLAASERVRAQAGLRERFADGIRVSRRYLPEMESIFREAGLPAELTRLPLIESCFDVRAYSWKGAAGVWQFMPETGRVHGLRVDRLVDERRDPIRATGAAARYLGAAYAELGTWPLAITSYNHGIKGIARGVDAVGSRDIVVLIDRYEGRAFGFAGRNFYPEFLAALEIDRDPERHFGPLEYEAPVDTEEVLLTRSITVHSAARATGSSPEVLAAHNPALSGAVASGTALMPRGYRLRLPVGAGGALERHLAAVPAALEQPRMARAANPGVHKVGGGETLSRIAARYGTSVGALMRHNRLRNPDLLRSGQLIGIPDDAAGSRAATRGYVSHRVQRGQTLSQIAARYGTSVDVLRRQNGIRNPRRLRVGQVIKVPAG
jgi:membrane-bound lytic murein transglycosylase D